MDTPDIESTTAEQAEGIKKPRSQKRRRQYGIHLMLTAEEDASLRAKAHAAGKRPGDFLRGLISGLKIQAIPKHPEDHYRNLRQIGNNLNQIARHLNSGTNPAATELQEIIRLCDEVLKNAGR